MSNDKRGDEAADLGWFRAMSLVDQCMVVVTCGLVVAALSLLGAGLLLGWWLL